MNEEIKTAIKVLTEMQKSNEMLSLMSIELQKAFINDTLNMTKRYLKLKEIKEEN